MKSLYPILALLVCSLPNLGFAREAKVAVAYPLEYEGGNLPLKPNRAVKAMVVDNQIVLVQRGKRFALPVQGVSELSCSSEVQRRFGASVLGVVPVLHLGSSEKDFVGLTWTAHSPGGRPATVIFKLSAAEYRTFVAALEKQTGKKAVDTRKTPTVVHYGL